LNNIAFATMDKPRKEAKAERKARRRKEKEKDDARMKKLQNKAMKSVTKSLRCIALASEDEMSPSMLAEMMGLPSGFFGGPQSVPSSAPTSPSFSGSGGRF
jgi:hypothetical protein